MALNGSRFRSAWMAFAVCTGLLVVSSSGALAKKGDPKPLQDTADTAYAYLSRFEGNWTGAGEFEGSPIEDGLAVQRILGDLYVQFRQDDLLGDFEAHMYFGYDAQDEHYELYVFGSFTGFGGNLPVRVMSGHRVSDNVLIVQEAKDKGKDAAREQLRYTFEFLDADSFVLSKTWITGKKGDEPFVVELFERDP